MYDLFGKYGAIRQVRMSSTPVTKGTAFVIYEDIYDAAKACKHLSGFNVKGRYLVVVYYKPEKAAKRADAASQLKDLEQLKKKYKVETDETA